MTSALRQAAAPPCPECALPVARLEQRWHLSDGEWRLTFTLVCPSWHKTRVVPA